MNLAKDLICINCGEKMEEMNTYCGVDLVQNRYCKGCNLHVILYEPNDDYEYKFSRLAPQCSKINSTEA